MRGKVEVEGEEMAVSPSVEKRSVRVPNVSEVGELPGTMGWGRTEERVEKSVGSGVGGREGIVSSGGSPPPATACGASCSSIAWE